MSKTLNEMLSDLSVKAGEVKVVNNGAVYLIQCPMVTSQYIGSGKTELEAVNDALDSIEKHNFKVR